MVSWTWPTLPSLRLRFALLEDARWRNPGLRRRILPVAVILNRLATAFFVLRRAMDFGMGGGTVASELQSANFFSRFWKGRSAGSEPMAAFSSFSSFSSFLSFWAVAGH